MKKVFLLALVLVFVPFVSYAQVGDVDPNASQCVELKNNLRLRDRDAQKNGEVSLLQDFLQEKGYLSSEPTGFFGQMTLKAVQAYQRAQGLNPTGFVGELTRGKIKSESGCSGTTPPFFPAGCTSFQGYSSVNGNACNGTTPPPPTYLPGCTSRQGYSSVNGNACDGTVPPAQTFLPGCTSTQGYSSVNGNACNGTIPPGYPAGCSSFQGYSSVTGNACNTATPNTTENIVANGGPRTLSVEYVSGKKNTYFAGEKITLKIKGVELFDRSLAEPSEGYHIQAEIREVGSSSNNGHGIQSVNATYDYGNKYWVVKMIAPGNSAESYELSSVLYCSNGSLVCGTRHGGDNGQTVAPFMFTVSGIGIFPIKVISPNGGEAYQVGQVNQVPITWAATCGYKSFSADIVRDNGDFYDSYTINPVTAGVCTPNQLAIPYSTMWSIPPDMRPGNYKLVVRGQLLEAGSFVEFGSGFAGISDSFFIVRSGN